MLLTWEDIAHDKDRQRCLPPIVGITNEEAFFPASLVLLWEAALYELGQGLRGGDFPVDR